jgi:hypothetical protein
MTTAAICIKDAIAFFWKFRSAAVVSELFMAFLDYWKILVKRGAAYSQPGFAFFMERQNLLLLFNMPTA